MADGIGSGHDWEDRTVTRSRSVTRFVGKDGDETVIDLNLTFLFTDRDPNGDDPSERLPSGTLHVCRRCGAELINGAEPAESCEARQVRDVMES